MDLLAQLTLQLNEATRVSSGEPAEKSPFRIKRNNKSGHFKPLNLEFVSLQQVSDMASFHVVIFQIFG